MAAESFFSRWSRKKAEATDALTPAEQLRQDSSVQPSAPAEPPPPPTLEDAAALTPDADFSRFVARGVDEAIKRTALKKLFTDPHFNVMDGLDIYIDDYTKFEPIPPEMLAQLEHAKSVLNPLDQLKRPLLSMLDAEPRPAADTAPAAQEMAADATEEQDAAPADSAERADSSNQHTDPDQPAGETQPAQADAASPDQQARHSVPPAGASAPNAAGTPSPDRPSDDHHV